MRRRVFVPLEHATGWSTEGLGLAMITVPAATVVARHDLVGVPGRARRPI
jgi:hypothetical protein